MPKFTDIYLNDRKYINDLFIFNIPGVGLSWWESCFWLIGGVSTAHGTYRGILSRSGIPLCLFAECTAFHQTPRTPRRGLCSLRASAKPQWRGWQGESSFIKAYYYKALTICARALSLHLYIYIFFSLHSTVHLNSVDLNETSVAY